jgi:hypothetical protein
VCSATQDYFVSLLCNEKRAKRKIPPSTPRNRSATADDYDATAASVAGQARTTSVTCSGGRAARGRSDSAGQGARARGGDVHGDVRGGARAERVQEDSETDNENVGTKRQQERLLQIRFQVPSFLQMCMVPSFNIQSHTGTYGYI